jgi:hypothetical protein
LRARIVIVIGQSARATTKEEKEVPATIDKYFINEFGESK